MTEEAIREAIANTTLRPCTASDIYRLLRYGEILVNDAEKYLGRLPKGAAACVVKWPDEETVYLVLGTPKEESSKVDWCWGRVKWVAS